MPHLKKRSFPIPMLSQFRTCQTCLVKWQQVRIQEGPGKRWCESSEEGLVLKI